MTVYPLERNSVFEPEIIQVMAGVYEEVLGELRLADRDDALAEVIAKEVRAAGRGRCCRDAPLGSQLTRQADSVGTPAAFNSRAKAAG